MHGNAGQVKGVAAYSLDLVEDCRIYSCLFRARVSMVINSILPSRGECTCPSISYNEGGRKLED